MEHICSAAYDLILNPTLISYFVMHLNAKKEERARFTFRCVIGGEGWRGKIGLDWIGK